MSNVPLSSQAPDYRALFEATPGRYIVLSPDFMVVAVTDAYLHATMTERSQVVGRNLFDVFPTNPDDTGSGSMLAVRGSLGRVVKNGAPDTIAVQQYDIRRPDAEGGAYEQRFWSLHSYPIFATGRELRYIMHEIEDVTEFIHLQRQGTAQQELTVSLQNRAAQMEHEIYRYVQEVQAARAAADGERGRLRELLLQAPGLLAVLEGPALVYTLANAPYRQLMGASRALEGVPLAEAVPDIAPELLAVLRRVYESGERFAAYEFPITLDWSASGQRETKYLDLVYEPIREAEGVTGIFVFAYDITDLVRARQRLEEGERLLRQALDDAEAARRRLELLSDGSVRLASLHEYEATLQAVAELAVPTLADFCFFDVPDGSGMSRRVAMAHADTLDPARFAAASRCSIPDEMAQANPIAAALGGGGTQLVTDVSDARLQQIAADAHHLAFMRQLGFHTLLTVPIEAHGEVLGALTFGLVDPKRRLMPADQEVAEELARRAALAIDNLRLYARAEHARADAERRLAELTAVIESMPDGVYIGTADGITMSNPQGLALLGYDKLDDLARDIGVLSGEIQTRDLESGRRLTSEDEAFAHALRGQPMVRDVVVRHRKTGEDRILRSAAAPIRYDGQILGAVAVNTDITERKRTELERADLLRREQAARAQAEAAVTVRDEFLSVAAHELKTPVTSMRGYAQLVLKQMSKGRQLDPERLQRSLDAINSQSEKLTRFIDQLLDVSKIAAGRLELHWQPLELGRLVADVVDALRPLTVVHNLAVQVDGPLIMTGDPLRLEQVITNLVTNAIKYSPEGGDVVVRVDRAAPDAVRITVADRGIGIPPEHRPFIFDRFYQAHGAGYFGGMGLGLSISRHIVQLHGGTLHAEFPAEGGTWMVVLLPVSRDTDLSLGVEAAA